MRSRKDWRKNNVNVQMFTLFLLDKSMKKLDQCFYQEVATRPFMNLLIILLTDPDTVDMIKTKILQLIQQWGIQFENNPDVPLFGQIYKALKARRDDFPDEDQTREKLMKGKVKSPPKATPQKPQKIEESKVHNSPLDKVPVKQKEEKPPKKK